MADEKIEIEIQLDDGSIKKGFVNVERQSKKTASRVGDDFRNATKEIGKFAAGFAAAFVGVQGITRAVRNLREFETALAEVSTITNQTAREQNNLKNQLIGVSAQFGTSASDQAKAYYQIISAGVTDAAAATELLTQANKLAIGGLTSTASAIDILTSAVNSFGRENLSSERAADILFGTVRLGKTTIDELSATLGRVLPTASTLGVEFEDVNAALATLTTRGVQTTEAITGLNAVFTAVLRGQEAAAKLGEDVAEVFNLQALQAKGLSGFLRDTIDAVDGSEAALQKLLGSAEATRAVLTLAGDDFVTFNKNVESLEESAGAANRAFEEVAQTVDQKLNRAVARYDAILLKISATQEGPLAASLDFLNKQLNDILSAFNTFGSFGDFVLATIFSIEEAFIGLVISIVETLSEIPLVGKKVFGDFNTGILGVLNQRRDEVTNAIVSLFDNEKINEQAKQAGQNLGDNIIPDTEEPTLTPESGRETFNEFDELANGFTGRLAELRENAKKSFNEIGAAAVNGLGKGVGSAFAAFGSALAEGENALEAFGKTLIAAIGQQAIVAGTEIILRGIAYLADPLRAGFGAAMIAKGGALAAFGGALTTLGGGAESASGGGVTPSPDDGFIGTAPISPDEDEIQEPGTQIAVNIQGDVLDSDDSGLRIANLLQKELDKSGKSILQVT